MFSSLSLQLKKYILSRKGLSNIRADSCVQQGDPFYVLNKTVVCILYYTQCLWGHCVTRVTGGYFV